MNFGWVAQTNANLYHYAGNNPVCYTDPDGKEIVAAKEPDGLRKDFETAVKYLMQSTGGAGIAKKIILSVYQDSSFSITVIAGKDGSGYDDLHKVLIWDRENVSYNPDTKVYNSPAIGLLHELTHAWIDNTKEGRRLFNFFVDANKVSLDKMYDAYLEDSITPEISRIQFYKEQFTTEIEKVVSIDLEKKARRNLYFELDSLHIIKVNSVLESGLVE